jgi:uncharacterized protein (TIGR03435 family)
MRLLALLALGAAALLAQPSPQVPGSIDQTACRSAAPRHPHPSRTRRPPLDRDTPVTLLIRNAYGLENYQIAGGPAWRDAEGCDLAAKPDGKTGTRETWLMLQSLLADRFQLALHHETREISGFTITAAKGGPRLRAPKEGAWAATDRNTPSPPPPPGMRQLPDCGFAGVRPGPRLEGHTLWMAALATALARVSGRPVADATGFDAAFDVDVDFTPDESTIGMAGAGGPRDPGGFAPTPSDPTARRCWSLCSNSLVSSKCRPRSRLRCW